MPPKFFITHSWKDIEFAKRLTDDLRKHGLDGFFDAYSIQPGDDIAGRIAKGLEECDIYVPLLSPAAVASKWCELEIHTAINLSMESERNGRPRIIPVVVKSCQLPTLLKGKLHIRFDGKYDDALNQLIAQGFGVASRQAQPPPKQSSTPPARVVVPPPPKIILSFAPETIALPRTRTGKDGKELLLIPAGDFMMGSNEGRENEKSPHKVYLDTFYISRYPVTNAEYKKFVDETRSSMPISTNESNPSMITRLTERSERLGRWLLGEVKTGIMDWQIPHGKETHPVVNVTWKDAVAYCEWASARLPTEAEWEKAASWDDAKKEQRVYPWGKDFDASKCNTSESGIGGTTPVGKYCPQGDSAYGIADVAGNVWAWCSSRWGKSSDKPDFNYPYQANDGREDLQSTDRRIVRGGSWGNNLVSARCATRSRFNPDNRDHHLGFCVAESVPS